MTRPWSAPRADARRPPTTARVGGSLTPCGVRPARGSHEHPRHSARNGRLMIAYQDATVTLHAGDCLDVLRDLPDASVDPVVTDPPYNLSFMSKAWDRI